MFWFGGVINQKFTESKVVTDGLLQIVYKIQKITPHYKILE